MSQKAKQLEEQYKKPLADILIELYAEHQNVYKMAKVLGVNQSTISYWMARYRLRISSYLVKGDYVPTSEGSDYVRVMQETSSMVSEASLQVEGVAS